MMRDVTRRRVWMALAMSMLVLATAQPVLAAGTGAMFFGLAQDWVGRMEIWALICLSMVTTALVIRHLMENRLDTIRPADIVQTMSDLLAERKFREAIELATQDQSVFGEIMRAALSRAAHGYNAMLEAGSTAAEMAAGRRIRRMEMLNVIGATGTMFGLFGTVHGMIIAFSQIASSDSQPKPSEMAGGIGIALVCTFWGLVISIPAVSAYALIRNKVEGQVTETVNVSEEILARFRSATKGAAPEPAKGK